MMKQIFILSMMLCVCWLIGVETVHACTSAIISGKVTPDGRPVMWKNRDTDNLLNCVRYMKGERYDFVAVTGYADNPTSIWIGINEAGFAIMNTLSYNLKEEEGDEPSSKRNGAVMKRALEICATVSDFKHYLDTLRKPMSVRTNYGVIDARGNGSYFEVNSRKYTEYDVNDPYVAPHGYLVRTNFSVSGELNEGAGYVRYQEAEQTIFTASASREITPEWLFSTLSRSFRNPLLDIDLKSGQFNTPQTGGWFVEYDFIARRSSSCAVAVQGVKPDEDASFTTMWTVIGYPPVTPAIPVWVKGASEKLPRLLTREKNEQRSPLCDASSVLRNKVYSYHRGMNTEAYFHWELLFNKQGDGYMQQNEKIERELFRTTYPRIDMWRKEKSPSKEEIFRLYDDCDGFIAKKFRELLHLEI
ncbi:MAG: C45 family peptidase [Dysgonamonadaceae bacterium]|nr:C45 family peptidase [Dysgonamonadaceae bacterium]